MDALYGIAASVPADVAPARQTGAVRYLLGGAACILLLVGAVGLAVMDMRDATLADARRSTSDLGRVLAEHSTRSFQAVDLVLQDTVIRLEGAAAGSPQTFGSRMAGEDVHAVLRERLRSLPQAEAISVIDRFGQSVNDTRVWPISPINVADSDYFVHLREIDTEQTFMSTAVRNRTSGLWTIYAARRVNDAAGQFVGIVMAALSVPYMEEFFGAVTVQPGGSVALIRLTGQMLASFPHDEARLGTVIPVDAEWARALRVGGGTYRSDSEPDGKPRIVSVHVLNGLPLAVRVSLTEKAALAGWHRQALGIMAGALFAALCLAVLLQLVVRQFETLQLSRASLSQRNGELEQVRLRLERQARDLERAAEALGASEQREAENADVLQTTLENIDQGLMMIDSDHRVAVYNQRVLEMLELPSALLQHRPKFDDVLAFQWQKDEFATANKGVVGFVRSGGLVTAPHVYERTRPNGRVIEVRSRPLSGGGLVRTYTDITERKAADARIRFVAHHDGLTMLSNRVVLQDHLDQAVAACATSGQGLALLYIDLDRFKPINDTYGHSVGDQLLIEVASRMRGMVREEDLVARMGGDEFAIVQTAVGQPDAAASLARRLIERMAEPFLFDGMRLSVGLSIGIGVYPTSGTESAELRRNADIALYRAKESGRNTYRFFDAEMDRRQQARFQMEQDLRDAVGLQAFHLVYQPIWDVLTGDVVGFETLLRWTHATRGPIGPEEFVPMAELNGLIVPLGRWVMETACAEAATWSDNLHIAVNLSPLQFRQGNLTEEVVGILRRTGLAPGRLELEVTEGVLLEDSGQVLQTMYSLQALGVSITLDDFGTGHASLSYLRRFPFDKIKIDKSFIRNLQDDTQSVAIVEAVLLLSRRLGLNVVAEGVETEAQLDRLRELRCPLIQGFLKGRPMLAEAARTFTGQPTA